LLPALKRWLREPLLHFLLLGLLLFGVYAYINRGRGGVESSKQIELTLDDLRQMEMYFESQWHRPPTQQEFQAMVEDKVREEVLYREGIAMGLDKDDTIVKAWYENNGQKFALPSRASFRHLYFSPDRRGQSAHDDAVKALAKISGQPKNSKLAASLADRFMFQDYYGDRAPEQLAKEFGPKFAQALFQAKPGSWQGPIESGYGWHLVFVDSVIPGRIQAFEEVGSDVKTAWLGDQKTQAIETAYKAMRAKYTKVHRPAAGRPCQGYSECRPGFTSERRSHKRNGVLATPKFFLPQRHRGTETNDERMSDERRAALN
jgi:hypothetical protein